MVGAAEQGFAILLLLSQRKEIHQMKKNFIDIFFCSDVENNKKDKENGIDHKKKEEVTEQSKKKQTIACSSTL